MTRFRHHSAITVALLITALSAITLAAAGLIYLLIPVLLLIAAYGAWRAGTDATTSGLRVRALLSSREIAWPHVAALSADKRGHVFAMLTNGNAVELTAVRRDDLPKLVSASGQPLQVQ